MQLQCLSSRLSTLQMLATITLRTLRTSNLVTSRFERGNRSGCQLCLDHDYATPNQPRNEQRGLQLCRPCQSQPCLRPSWPQLRRRPYVGSVEGEEGQGGLPHLQQVQVAGCREPGLLQAVLWDVRIKRANPLSHSYQVIMQCLATFKMVSTQDKSPKGVSCERKLLTLKDSFEKNLGA